MYKHVVESVLYHIQSVARTHYINYLLYLWHYQLLQEFTQMVNQSWVINFIYIPYNGLFSPGANFPKWQILYSFSRSFCYQKFTRPTTEKVHVSDISYKVDIGNTVVCRTLTLSTIIIDLYSCLVTMCTCICTGVFKNSRFSTVHCKKKVA